ncbi:MAG: 1-acyl-sn-glycerol-3-phosphate acyltransferase [SAR324 cluster bacterium]|nr:1-acyl-sn-glycerol-3-phosphate acyltransferase [SAR324 cluster bacterium]
MILRTLWIFVQVMAATMRITIPTVYETQRGKYRREAADARLAWWSAKVLGITKVSHTIFNPFQVELKPGKPYVIMSNHGSFYDIPLVYTGFLGSIRMLAKKELFRIPFLGSGMGASEFISVDRHNRQQALLDLENARQKMVSGITIWLAPEGTRSRSGKLQPFKKGGFKLALQMGATIIPMGIRGTREIMPPDSWSIHPGKHVEIHIGEPIDTTPYAPAVRDELMEKVAQQIQKLANLERQKKHSK